VYIGQKGRLVLHRPIESTQLTGKVDLCVSYRCAVIAAWRQLGMGFFFESHYKEQIGYFGAVHCGDLCGNLSDILAHLLTSRINLLQIGNWLNQKGLQGFLRSAQPVD
jgi:hypothetical protein